MITANADYPTVSLLLGLVAGSFALVVSSPVWALAPILFTELTLPGQMIESLGVSLRLVVVLSAATMTVFVVARCGLFGDGRARRVLLPALILIALATLGNALSSDADYVLKYFRYQIVQLVTLVLAAALLRDRSDLKRLAVFALTIGLASAGSAIWQHYDRESAIYGPASPLYVAGWKGRVLGLTESPVMLANDLIFILLPLLGLLAVSPLRLDRTRALLLAAAFVLGAGLYFTYTRSAVAGVAAGLAAIGLCLKGDRRKIILGVVVLVFVLFELLRGTGLIGYRYYRDASNDNSAASREALRAVGIAIALDNSLVGIGRDNFERMAVEYGDDVELDELALRGEKAIGRERPHNDFLGVWASWGLPALVAYLAMFIGTLANYLAAARRADRLVRGLAIGCVGGLVAYGLNSAYHNSLDSSTYLFMYAGLSIALARLPAWSAALSRGRRRLLTGSALAAVPRVQLHSP
ncbi:MAG: O-antigen ligase family protein [Chloroflexi bacterium]|nr:O-antigen ligase family protein [Chloroflexota bacterium]